MFFSRAAPPGPFSLFWAARPAEAQRADAGTYLPALPTHLPKDGASLVRPVVGPQATRAPVPSIAGSLHWKTGRLALGSPSGPAYALEIVD